jgi:hypothetical protein
LEASTDAKADSFVAASAGYRTADLDSKDEPSRNEAAWDESGDDEAGRVERGAATRESAGKVKNCLGRRPSILPDNPGNQSPIRDENEPSGKSPRASLSSPSDSHDQTGSGDQAPHSPVPQEQTPPPLPSDWTKEQVVCKFARLTLPRSAG